MSQSQPLIEIEHGKLLGKVCKTLDGIDFYSFKGIPYAKPPIGELRFAVPVDAEPWTGIKDATSDCNVCAQYDKFSNTLIGCEDCLYLNVYTPKLSDGSSLLPVMFFIHGGGFVFGHGTDPFSHGPEFLIAKDVVIVSINYRLGILGFLNLNCKDAPGNMGLRDQVQALKWVQKNISKFCGDPNNVTIFGISAGAATVEYHLLSSMSEGLFHKAIAQGGSSLCSWAQSTSKKVKDLALKIPAMNGKTYENDEQLLNYLKNMSMKDLVTSSMIALTSQEFRGGINFGFVPTIEKSGDWEPFLDKSTYDLLSRGKFNKVPFISGFCSREGLLMVPMGASILDKLVDEKVFINSLPFEIDDTGKAAIEAKLKSVYLESETVSKDLDGFAIDFFTDVIILGGVHMAASLISRSNSPVYFYEFSYDGSMNYVKKWMKIDREGACHSDESGYVFRIRLLSDNFTDTDKQIRDRIVEMWTNFAKYGDPTPSINNLITTKWEPISETGISCLVIDEKLAMKHDVYQNRMKLFREFYEKYYPA